MTHTPGPWHIETETDSFGWVNHAINNGHNYGADVNAANARLIAAAPELLESLEWVMSEVDEHQEECPQTVLSDEAKDMARAAIAKAKGTPC